MIVRNLIGHHEVVMVITLNREFWPLTACCELIQNEIAYLIEGLVTLIATFSGRKMWTNILIELWFGHFGGNCCHVHGPFFWACSQALLYSVVSISSGDAYAT